MRKNKLQKSPSYVELPSAAVQPQTCLSEADKSDTTVNNEMNETCVSMGSSTPIKRATPLLGSPSKCISIFSVDSLTANKVAIVEPSIRPPKHKEPILTASIASNRPVVRRLSQRSNKAFNDGVSLNGSSSDVASVLKMVEQMHASKIKMVNPFLFSAAGKKNNFDSSMPEIGENKNAYILAAKLQTLASKLEKRKKDFDHRQMLRQLNSDYTQKLYELAQQRDEKDGALSACQQQLLLAKEQIRIRDLEISVLKNQVSSDGETRCNQCQNENDQISKLQQQILTKDERIKYLEEMLEIAQKHPSNSSSETVAKPQPASPRLIGVEILSEYETEEEE